MSSESNGQMAPLAHLDLSTSLPIGLPLVGGEDQDEMLTCCFEVVRHGE